jgi:hypothetical protein
VRAGSNALAQECDERRGASRRHSTAVRCYGATPHSRTAAQCEAAAQRHGAAPRHSVAVQCHTSPCTPPGCRREVLGRCRGLMLSSPPHRIPWPSLHLSPACFCVFLPAGLWSSLALCSCGRAGSVVSEGHIVFSVRNVSPGDVKGETSKFSRPVACPRPRSPLPRFPSLPTQCRDPFPAAAWLALVRVPFAPRHGVVVGVGGNGRVDG